MKAWVGVTDGDWYRFLRDRSHLDEVNFWQPSGGRQFRALAPGELFLFKLHHPENYIVGGGLFAHYSQAPSRLVWEAFREKNGAPTYQAMRQRIEKYRRVAPSPHEDYDVGCILLTQPFFFDRADWIPTPSTSRRTSSRGKPTISRLVWATRFGRPLKIAYVLCGSRPTPRSVTSTEARCF